MPHVLRTRAAPCQHPRLPLTSCCATHSRAYPPAGVASELESCSTKPSDPAACCTSAMPGLHGTIFAAQAAFTLAQLLTQRLAWLSEVLAAIEHDAGLARLGLTEAVLSVMLGAALEPVLQARHSTGPSGLQSPGSGGHRVLRMAQLHQEAGLQQDANYAGAALAGTKEDPSLLVQG